MRNKVICIAVFFCVFMSGQVRAVGQQQGTDKPTPDEIMAAQAQANQAAAYRRTEQFEHQQLYAQQQQTLRQSGIQSQQGAADEIQPRDGRPHPRKKEPDWDPNRQNYDPMAGPGARKQSWSGAMDAATGHINPCNNDYGGLLAQWHIALAQETIANLYFYLLVLETGGIFALAMFLIEMRTERKRRLQIAGGVVAQLFNQYAHARSKAYEAIRAHNQLVEDKEDSLDSLLGDGSVRNESLPTPPVLDLARVSTVKSANIMSGTSQDGDAQLKGNSMDDEDSASPSSIPKEAFQVKPVIPATVIDKAETLSGIPSAADIEGELETKQRQIETLQARLQNKTLRINELEDALTVSASKNKIPEI